MKFSIRRLAVMALPILSVGAIAYAGSVILQGSHAQSVTPDQAGASSAHFASSADSACCHLSVSNITSNLGEFKRISMDLSVTNSGASVLQISPGLQVSLIDTNGVTYPYTAKYLAPNVVVGGPIAPGANAVEHLDFDISPTAMPHILSFQVDGSVRSVQLGAEL